MAFNPLDYLKDLVPQNTNMFGASPNANLKQMSEMGLLGGDYEDMLAKANKQSVFQGLLNAGLSYAAQPKNQGYGSIFPYLAKAGLAGVNAAQKPYDQQATNAMQTYKLKEMQRVKEGQTAMKDLYTTLPSTTQTVQGMYGTKPINQPLPNGTTALRPNFGQKQTGELTTPQRTVLDQQKLMELKANYPMAYAKFLTQQQGEANLQKTQAEANALNNPPPNVTKEFENYTLAGGEAVTGLPFGKWFEANKSGQKIEVSLGDKANSAVQNKAIDYFSTIQQNINAGIPNAQELAFAAQLSEMSGDAQGFGAEAIQKIDTLASRFGIEFKNADQQDYIRVLKTAQIKLALGEKKPGTGPMTDKDFENFLATTLQISNPLATNRIIAYVAKRKQQMQEEFADAFVTEVDEKGYGTNVYTFERKYFKDRQEAYIKDIKENIERISDSTRNPGSNSDVLNIIDNDLLDEG